MNFRRIVAGTMAAASALFFNPIAQAQTPYSEPWWIIGSGGLTKLGAQFLPQIQKAVPSDNGDIPGGFLATLHDTAKVPSVETRVAYFPKASDAKDDGRIYYSNDRLTFFAILPPTGLTSVAMTVCGELNNKAVYYGAIRSDGKVEQKPIEKPDEGCTPPLRKAKRELKALMQQASQN